MGKTRERLVQNISAFKGQNSGLTPDAVEPDYAARVKNMISDRGFLKKVNGRSVYGVLSGSGQISLLEYYSNFWLAQRGTTLFKEDSVGGKTFSSLKTLLSSTKLFAARWKNAIYFANGRDLFFYNFDLQKVKQLGMYPPLGTVDNANISAAAGGSLSDGAYKYTITYFDPDTQTESPAINSRPSSFGLCVQDPFSTSDYAPDFWSITIAAPNSTAKIAFAALNAIFGATGESARDDRQTHFKVYRTTVGGTVFRQVGTPTSISAFILAGSDYSDASADSSLGIPLQTDGASPPPRFERIDEAINTFKGLGLTVNSSTVRTYIHTREFKDSLLGFGAYGIGVSSATESAAFPAYKSILYIHDTFLPDYVFTTRDVADGDGQLPTGIATLKDNTVLLLKESSTYYLAGTNVRNYEVRPLDTKRGCIATGSIQETPYGVICLDRSGVILFDGLSVPQEISHPAVEDEIRNINFNAIDTVYSIYDRDNSLYYLALPVDGSTKPNRTLIYNAKHETWTVSEGLEGYSGNIGIDPSQNPVTLIGDSVNQDKILDWSSESAVLDVAKSIESEYLSPILYMGDPSVKKKAKFLYILAESNQDWTIDIGILPDFGQYNGENILENINSSSNYAVWASSLLDSGVNVGVFDTSNWSGTKVRKMIKVPVSGVGYGFQIRIKNKDTNPDDYGFTLLSLKLEAVELGK
jgi:hypothetical protein